jgi:hypothetical protein
MFEKNKKALMKSQIASFKKQTNSKNQIQNSKPLNACLRFVYLNSGFVWYLVLGICIFQQVCLWRVCPSPGGLPGLIDTMRQADVL